MPILNQFKQWRNGETFNARDYVYERDTIVNQVNRLSVLVGDTTSSSTISVGTLSATGAITAGTSITAGTNITASGSVTADSLSVDSITMGGETITDFAQAGTLTNLSTSAPQSSDGEDGEVWIEYSE